MEGSTVCLPIHVIIAMTAESSAIILTWRKGLQCTDGKETGLYAVKHPGIYRKIAIQ